MENKVILIMKAKIDIRFSFKINFLTPNFILEVNKHEIGMQRAHIVTSGTSNNSFYTQFFVLMSAGIAVRLDPILSEVHFAVGDFL